MKIPREVKVTLAFRFGGGGCLRSYPSQGLISRLFDIWYLVPGTKCNAWALGDGGPPLFRFFGVPAF